MNSKRLGNIGEAKAISKFVEMQIPVYIPFGDVEKSDLIADFNGKLNRIQVKTCEKFKNNSFTVGLRSSTIRHQKNYIHKYNKSEIDYFVVYNISSDTLLMFPIEKFENRTAIKITIPYKKGRNQYETINWEDYTFEKIIKN